MRCHAGLLVAISLLLGSCLSCRLASSTPSQSSPSQTPGTIHQAARSDYSAPTPAAQAVRQPTVQPDSSPNPGKLEPSLLPADGDIRATAALIPALATRTVTPVSVLELHDQAPALLPWAREELARGTSARWEDLAQYSINLSVDSELHTIDGTVTVRYVNREDVPLPEIVFRLFPETPGYGGEMEVSSVRADGRPVASRLEMQNSALYVELDQPLLPGEAVILDLGYTAVVPEDTDAGYAQFSHADGILALPNAYPLIPAYDDEGWNVELAPSYGDAVYSDVALYRVRLTAPSNQVLVASGTAIERVQTDGDSTITTLVTGPVRDVAIVMSSEYSTSTEVVDGVRVNSYYLPEDQEGGERCLAYGADALRTFNSLFGAYPYAELDLVETATTAGGIEYPGLVVIAQRLYDQTAGFFEFVVVHEVAHQWWYALVGNDQVDEPWLDEALAQYSTMLYYEEVHGVEAADEVRRRTFEEPYEELVTEGRDAPVGQPVRAFSREEYGPIVYGKGPLLFQELRDDLGDQVFFSLLRSYFSSYRYGVASSEDFAAAAEKESGRELDSLFHEWLWESDR